MGPWKSWNVAPERTTEYSKSSIFLGAWKCIRRYFCHGWSVRFYDVFLYYYCYLTCFVSSFLYPSKQRRTCVFHICDTSTIQSPSSQGPYQHKLWRAWVQCLMISVDCIVGQESSRDYLGLIASIAKLFHLPIKDACTLCSGPIICGPYSPFCISHPCIWCCCHSWIRKGMQRLWCPCGFWCRLWDCWGKVRNPWMIQQLRHSWIHIADYCMEI